MLKINDAAPWSTWVLSDHADDGSYVVALRAMFGFESGEYLRQNLANAFIVNYLWLPALLALVTLVLVFRRPSPRAACGAAAVLLVGTAVIYAWTTLTFPTFTEPRYATPLIMLTILVVFDRPAPVAAQGPAGHPRRAAVRVRRGRLGADRPGLAQALRAPRSSAASRSTTPTSAIAAPTGWTSTSRC